MSIEERRLTMRKKAKKKAVPKKKQAGTGRDRRRSDELGMVTIAFRDEFTPMLRGLADESGLSLAKVVREATLLYRQALKKGHVAGSLLAEHKAKLAGKAKKKKKKKAKK